MSLRLGCISLFSLITLGVLAQTLHAQTGLDLVLIALDQDKQGNIKRKDQTQTRIFEADLSNTCIELLPGANLSELRVEFDESNDLKKLCSSIKFLAKTGFHEAMIKNPFQILENPAGCYAEIQGIRINHDGKDLNDLLGNDGVRGTIVLSDVYKDNPTIEINMNWMNH